MGRAERSGRTPLDKCVLGVRQTAGTASQNLRLCQMVSKSSSQWRNSCALRNRSFISPAPFDTLLVPSRYVGRDSNPDSLCIKVSYMETRPTKLSTPELIEKSPLLRASAKLSAFVQGIEVRIRPFSLNEYGYSDRIKCRVPPTCCLFRVTRSISRTIRQPSGFLPPTTLLIESNLSFRARQEIALNRHHTKPSPQV